jgi:hypothetical protein
MSMIQDWLNTGWTHARNSPPSHARPLSPRGIDRRYPESTANNSISAESVGKVPSPVWNIGIYKMVGRDLCHMNFRLTLVFCGFDL